MAETPEVAKYREAGALAKRILLGRAQAMYGIVMGEDGTTFGDTQMTRSDRILRWVEGAADGTVDALMQISPDIYRKELAQFNRDVAAELEASAKVRG